MGNSVFDITAFQFDKHIVPSFVIRMLHYDEFVALVPLANNIPIDLKDGSIQLFF